MGDAVILKIYVWRHNRKYHSWSMFAEPCVHDALYSDVIAVIVAETEEQALTKLAERDSGWRMEDLKRLTPKVYDLDVARVVFEDIRGD